MADKKINFRLKDGTEVTLNQEIIDALTSTDTDKALSANQGKELNESILGTTQLVDFVWRGRSKKITPSENNELNLDNYYQDGKYNFIAAINTTNMKYIKNFPSYIFNPGVIANAIDMADTGIPNDYLFERALAAGKIDATLIVITESDYDEDSDTMSNYTSTTQILIDHNPSTTIPAHIYYRVRQWSSDTDIKWSDWYCNHAFTIANSLNNRSEYAALSAYVGAELADDVNTLIDSVDELKESVDNIPQVTVTDSLTSTSTTEALSAAQGKALNEAKAPRPIFSTTDIEIGSALECGQLYFVMN